ncbi:piezo-type mechanosensitive ion channel component isoform X3 [Atheta coriaria]|uniref:piezo-type mechanosensitive ion channel component isoform X3 n=1 Tax=Dalotia coriaria TaxID=877792 RepID=UPI0031F41B89
MANFIVAALLFRVALPLIILTCVVFRPCVISGVYLLFMLISASLPVPTRASMNGATGVFLKLLIMISLMTSLGVIVFHLLMLLHFAPYGEFLKPCELVERIIRAVGLVKLDALDPQTVVLWLAPEVVMLIAAIVFFVIFSKMTRPAQTEDGIQLQEVIVNKKTNVKLFINIGKAIVICSLCLASILKPSIIGGFYFLIFLSTATWLGSYRSLEKGFAILLKFLMVVVFFHIFTLFAYQTEWPQMYLQDDSNYARWFGLTKLMYVNCDGDPRVFEYTSQPWNEYVNILCLIFLYFVMAVMSRQLLTQSTLADRKVHRTGRTVGESTPLMHDGKPKLYTSKGPSMLQDSTGSVIISNDNDIPMRDVEKTNSELAEDDHDDFEEPPTCFEKFVFACESLLMFIIRTSYIGTNIIMMAWSITYHSWITFVLLLWSSILWMVPNQRKHMLRCSPVLVLYAWFLLISAYIYSMNLTEDELPSKIDGWDMSQIGFIRNIEAPYKSLVIKCLYTVMFWITLRQFMKERIEARQSSALADMVAPVQLTVGTATGPLPHEHPEENETMKKVGHFVKTFLTKFWIWVVAITLFSVAITGERMTSFRILYMVLFLVFLLSFQFSFRVWRKIMFGFWLTVIIYSMIILVLVYTYQFDDFNKYWTEYLHVSEQQQLDIGLEKYETKQLFVRLVTPTFFVIITAVQLHYFHKDFLELSKPNSGVVDTTKSEAASSAQGGMAAQPPDDEDSEDDEIDLTDLENVSALQVQRKFKKFCKRMYYAINLACLFMELHLAKLVMFVGILVATKDVCAVHFTIVVLMVLGTTIGNKMLNVCIYLSSLLASVMLITRMLYQIEYIQHDIWNVTCDVIIDNQTKVLEGNTAQWVGYFKLAHGRDLPEAVKWNIVMILMVTLWCVINVRQQSRREKMGHPSRRPYFMFPKIRITNADTNLKTYIKYLANYMFYRLGVEICLIATVAVIALRMDLYALLYAFFLTAYFMMSRTTLARFWNVYLGTLAIVIPIQYFMVIGLPPGVCIDYPWDNSDILRSLQEWGFLLDRQYPPPAKKILCDFALLILVYRQSLVFRIEKRYANTEYAGGHNRSVIEDAETPNFEIPVPDFITYSRTYLDIFKRIAFLPLIWFTLAIVFLAGTNRVNIFSLGYLIGSFYFLWIGSDIYLRPIPIILEKWNYLILYNVLVILIKVILQFIGCVFFEAIKDNACWVIQILGISCLRKFKSQLPPALLTDQECEVPREFVGLAWDGACFAFLILMRRLFNSYNFFHIVNESKASAILASRGAELIEELRRKRMTEQDSAEKRIIQKIKTKMDRIKANQQKILGPTYKDPETHFIDSIYPKSRPMYRHTEPKSYKRAIRSGDYYMFDDIENEELDIFEDIAKDSDDEDMRETTSRTHITVGELISKSLKDNVASTLRQQRRSSLVERGRSSASQLSVPYSAPPAVSTERVSRGVPPDDDDAFDQQPSTSKSLQESEEPTEPPKISAKQKLVNALLFAYKLIQSLMYSASRFMYKFSKDHRYIRRMLSNEKRVLKETTDYTIGTRSAPNFVWEPTFNFKTLIVSGDSKEQEMSSADQPVFYQLMLSIWYIVLGHSDLLCYFIIFLNQIKNATFISLPLPLMVFLWGTLTVPRPSKMFWITIIAYTQIIVLIKCMFQFQILPWNQAETGAVDITSMIGIERKKNYALWDLILLLVVYFHRYMLKCLGLWQTQTDPPDVLKDGQYVLKSDGELVSVSPSTKHHIESSSHETAEDEVVLLSTSTAAATSMFPSSVKMLFAKYNETLHNFFVQLFDPTSRVAADVYTYLFLCDFYNFFVILIGYSSFGPQQGDGGVTSYLADNRVPVLFLIMLIMQFILIIIDRAIFLRKNIAAKIVFQFLQILFLHIWLFIIFPYTTGRNVNSVIPPQMYYMVKCFYLLLSAYQIRCGYPARILGNFICKGYGMINMALFKAFLLIPFLFELRTIMDWMWTDTSMTVFDWIKMEDIFAHIYQLKCSRYMEDEYPQPRGVRKASTSKYVMGGGLLIFIIGVIWFPLVFFSLGNAVGAPNVPYDVTVSLRLGPYEALYKTSAQSNSIDQFTENDFNVMQQKYYTNQLASNYINIYDYGDIAAVKLSFDSATVWSISPPDKERMIEEVRSAPDFKFQIQCQFSHITHTKEDPGTARVESEKIIYNKPNSTNIIRENLLDMLTQPSSNKSITLAYMFPKFVKVTNRGTADILSEFMDKYPEIDASRFRNVTLKLSTVDDKLWWEITEEQTDHNYQKYLQYLPYADSSSFMIYTFNDKIYPATLNIITGGGIIGLYTTLVFVASRLLRGFFSEICFKIMFDDMPNVDRVLQLCADVYLVREAGEFALEEDLFAKLVFLYRSPETLIKWTRPPEEIGEDEDPEAAE